MAIVEKRISHDNAIQSASRTAYATAPPALIASTVSGVISMPAAAKRIASCARLALSCALARVAARSLRSCWGERVALSGTCSLVEQPVRVLGPQLADHVGMHAALAQLGFHRMRDQERDARHFWIGIACTYVGVGATRVHVAAGVERPHVAALDSRPQCAQRSSAGAAAPARCLCACSGVIVLICAALKPRAFRSAFIRP